MFDIHSTIGVAKTLISSTHDFMTTVKMEIKRLQAKYTCISLVQHCRAFYVSLLHNFNLAVQFMTSITSEYEKISAKRNIMHVIFYLI